MSFIYKERINFDLEKKKREKKTRGQEKTHYGKNVTWLMFCLNVDEKKMYGHFNFNICEVILFFFILGWKINISSFKLFFFPFFFFLSFNIQFRRHQPLLADFYVTRDKTRPWRGKREGGKKEWDNWKSLTSFIDYAFLSFVEKRLFFQVVQIPLACKRRTVSVWGLVSVFTSVCVCICVPASNCMCGRVHVFVRACVFQKVCY